jgi:DNA-binding beta-propeller fold protein YncE
LKIMRGRWASAALGALANNVQVESEPTTIEFNPANNDIYVANRGSRSVSVIDGSTLSVNTAL